jgi:membrane protein DedA with SNARE-associated domain
VNALINVSGVIGSGGYLALFALIMLECIGLPLPGETGLIAAGIYAGHTHHLSLFGVVAVACAAAVVGDNVGYLIGRERGAALLERHGHRLRLTPVRLALLRDLYARRGPLIVIGGRFLSVVRTYASIFAGANAMPWPRFVVSNVVGAVAWSCVFGIGSYALGNTMKTLNAWLGVATAIVVLIAVGLLGLAFRRAIDRVESRSIAVSVPTKRASHTDKDSR